ncbi:MAG: insulinase family protein [FCB group bacterium]|nr:insulinase family protein [FCB group bacterium]
MIKKRNVADTVLYNKTVLKNGLRVVTEKIPSVHSISIGIWVDVGSRNEDIAENGVTHLIEHMLFKGTKNRSAKEIAASLESIGGSLNAFTSKEHTCYTARILDENLETAIDVLSDILCHATLSPRNLIKEKKVVCEEIIETKETPSDYIHDIFASTYWGDHPLGRPILGQQDNVINISRKLIINYIKENYKTSSIVVAASGAVPHKKLVSLVKDKFSFPVGRAKPFTPAKRITANKRTFVTNGNDQIHLCFGYPGLAYSSKDKMTALALHTYLGGGMSSVLFQKIREEKGLAYTVYTFLDFYRDAGVFGAYLATDKKNLPQCVAISLKELAKLKKKRLSSDKIEKAKAQLKGHLILGMESTSGRMSRLARSELMLGKYLSLKETLKQIDKVSSSGILKLANQYFDNSQLALAVLGPANANMLKNVV